VHRKETLERGILSLSAALLTLFLGACAGGVPDTRGTFDGASPSPSLDAYNLELLTFIASEGGLSASEIPETEVLAYVSLAEVAAAVGQCVEDTESGIGVEDDGSFIFETSNPDELKQIWITIYRCNAQYPVSADDTQPYTDEQKEIVADYMLVEQVSCLEDLGYLMETPPARSTFVAMFGDDMGQGLSPWYPTLVDPPTESEDVERMQELCPANVPLDRLYGD
jgi:hypothetical protein